VSVSPDSPTPSERAGAVLRAAEAAAAAARAEAPPAAAPPTPAPTPAPPPAAAARPAHESGAAGRLLAATDELDAQLARARAQLDAVAGALDRVEPSGRSE
jgi:hypothetical protein